MTQRPDVALCMTAFERVHVAVVTLDLLTRGRPPEVELRKWVQCVVARVESLGTVLGCEFGARHAR